jgi:hypothetical protein
MDHRCWDRSGLEILGIDLYVDKDDTRDEPDETTLGLAYGSGGGYQAAAANDLMLRLSETLRGPLGEHLRA